MNPISIEQLETRRLLASAELDIAFGEAGVAFTPGVWGKALLVNELSDGKVIMIASGSRLTDAFPNLSDDPVIARFNPDGTLDTSFDGDGILALAQDDGVVSTRDAAVGPGGKIYVLHNSSLPHEDDNQLTVFRFNADGTVDTSFGGGDGIVGHDLPDHRAEKIAVQSDGRIVVAYTSQFADFNDQTTYLARLNADGSIDATFRGGLAARQSTGFNRPADLTVGPSNEIVLSGSIYPDPDAAPHYWYGAVARFNANGSLDATFGGGDGFIDVLPVRNTEFDGIAAEVTIDPQGRPLLAYVHTAATVRRFATKGAIDTSFGGGDGIAEIATTNAGTTPVIVGADGSITGATSNWNGSTQLYRFDANGAVDATFGETARATSNRPLPPSEALALGDDGAVYVAGWYHGRDSASDPLGVARFIPDSPDVLVNPRGHLVINGSAGADTIAVTSSNGLINVRRNNVVSTFARTGVNKLIVFGGAGDDVITAGLSVDADADLGDGNNRLTLGDGNVTVHGGAGNDIVRAGLGNHLIHTWEGNDSVTTDAGKDRIYTYEGNDTIHAGNVGDYIDAGNGDDLVAAGNGNDRIFSGRGGKDYVNGAGGDDLIQGYEIFPEDPDSELPDQGTGGGADEVFYLGGEGNDTIVGGEKDDTLSGENGNDSIAGGAGDDEITGGFDTGRDTVADNDVIYGDNFDFFRFADGNDVIRGGIGNDWIDAQRGNDTIFGGDGEDKLFASDGDDSVWGENHNDRMYGGDGIDSMYGNGGNDRLEGGAQSDHLRGNGGRDRMYGNGGNDRMYGGASGDWMTGQSGNDQILGEGGNDRLYGDDGDRDTLRGGAGDDIFITLDGAIDQLFGDGGRDSCAARDDSDILASIDSPGGGG